MQPGDGCQHVRQHEPRIKAGGQHVGAEGALVLHIERGEVDPPPARGRRAHSQHLGQQTARHGGQGGGKKTRVGLWATMHAGLQFINDAAHRRGLHHGPNDQRAKLRRAQFTTQQNSVSTLSHDHVPWRQLGELLGLLLLGEPVLACDPRPMHLIRHALGPRIRRQARREHLLAQHLRRLGCIQHFPRRAPACEADHAMLQTFLIQGQIGVRGPLQRVDLDEVVSIRHHVIADERTEVPARIDTAFNTLALKR